MKRTIESAPWPVGAARRKATGQLTECEYRPEVEAVESLTGLHVETAMPDRGRHTSMRVSAN